MLQEGEEAVLSSAPLLADSTRRKNVGLGLWVRAQHPLAAWSSNPTVGQPPSASHRCWCSSAALVAALPITQGRLHRVSPRNANCFGLRLAQQSHRALGALSQLRDLPDPCSPSPRVSRALLWPCCSLHPQPHRAVPGAPWGPAACDMGWQELSVLGSAWRSSCCRVHQHPSILPDSLCCCPPVLPLAIEVL